MGEIADLYDMYDDDLEYGVEAYFNNGPEWLVENSANARKPTIISIRRQWKETKQISTKQQWVLSYWIMEQDRNYI